MNPPFRTCVLDIAVSVDVGAVANCPVVWAAPVAALRDHNTPPAAPAGWRFYRLPPVDEGERRLCLTSGRAGPVAPQARVCSWRDEAWGRRRWPGGGPAPAGTTTSVPQPPQP